MSKTIQLDLSKYRILHNVKKLMVVNNNAILKKYKVHFPLYKKSNADESLIVLCQNCETETLTNKLGVYEFIVGGNTITGLFDPSHQVIIFDSIKLMKVIKAAKPIKA